MTADSAHLLDELRTVEENCLYTAQAHFVIASRKGTAARVVFVGASALSAVAGGLVVAGLPAWVGLFAAVGGVVGAVCAALGADKDVHNHRVAANALTKLRHEARALRETFAAEMPKEQLIREVRGVSDSYNSLIQGLPPTDENAMNKARVAIQSGRLHPDFRVAQDASKSLPAGGRSSTE